MRQLGRYAAIAAGALVLFGSHQAFAQSKMKACADEWNKMKAANQTAGKTYREFSKECMSKTDTQATAPAATKPAETAKTTTAKTTSAPKTETKSTTTTPATKPTDGRQAMYARERACGADWKADKAAGKIPAGQKWPQYWSECDKRKKAQGM
jgi:hypothetical protein